MRVNAVGVIGLLACALGMACAGGCAASRTDASASPGMMNGPNTVEFKVEGMACGNCAKEIAHELEEVEGVCAASIDFDKATARVALDPDRPAIMEQLHAAVAKWRKEHFGLQEDPNCLDPKRRQEIKSGGVTYAAVPCRLCAADQPVALPAFFTVFWNEWFEPAVEPCQQT
ncbi:MAG: heavy-metal-associated domain-containing protein [Phycisphaerales bacterium]|nr:heavy-metal-associated domain-containing protein [Phycisphaerales bacterium]